MLNTCKYLYLIMVELSTLKSHLFGITEAEAAHHELYVGGAE